MPIIAQNANCVQFTMEKNDYFNQVFLRCSRCRSKRLVLRVSCSPPCVFIKCNKCGTLSLLGEYKGSFSSSNHTLTGSILFEISEVF